MNALAVLETHIADTYLRLRRGMGLLALLFPPVLWLGGAMWFGRPLQTSMSAYYHTGMRDVFVGVLCAIGSFLFLYKGFTRKEDLALNIAGACAAGIAFFAMDARGDCQASGGGFSLHGAFAVAFFMAIAYVCIFLSGDGPEVGIAAATRARYVAVQKACGAVMTACMAAGLVYAFLLPKPVRAGLCARNMVFWLEALAVWAFSIYWIVKSLEYDYAVSWLPWRRPVRVHGPATSDASSLPEKSHAETP
ncbi:MAG: hypothetical protein ACRECD_05585 [Burkholderiaceae bacterium]